MGVASQILYQKHRSIKALEEYQKLGTVDELRIAAEGMRPMAPDIGIDNGSKRRRCGNCGFFYEPTSHFCSWCGQSIKIKG